MKHIFTKSILTVLLLAPSSSVLATELNNNTNTSFEVKSGELNFNVEKSAVTFGEVNLTEVVKQELPFNKTASPGDVTIEDPRGTGEGYQLNIKAGSFINAAHNHTLKAGTLLIDRTESTFEGPGSEGVSLETGEVSIDNNNSVNLLSAGKDQGFAINTLEFKGEALKLKINQKDVKEGTYTSTIVYTLSSGPSA